ncbi:MAG: PAS domain-containing protein, partial [Kiritimatiellales bacterium]|nr:PAS domain-containing protein [Kiritimatiellales bacterium]
MFLWLLCNLYIIGSTTVAQAHHAIRLAYALSACIPTTFQLLRLSIKYQDALWAFILKRAFVQISCNALVIATCFIPAFIQSIEFPSTDGSPGLATPEYGPPYVLFNLYFVVTIIVFAVTLYRDRRQLTGAQRTELDFLGFACVCGLVVGLSFGTIFALVIKTSTPVPIAHAASVLALALIVAYGISVHRILAVAVILRKATAYALLSCYLTFLYLISWFCFSYVLRELSVATLLPAHIIATLIVVFSMAPMHGRFQRVADQLVSTHMMDIPSTMKKAGEIFQSVSTIDALLKRFSELLMAALGADDMRVLLLEGAGYVQHYPSGMELPSSISSSPAFSEIIAETKESISKEALIRLRQTKRTTQASLEFDSLGASLAAGIFTKNDLCGVALFGQRRGGRIYDKTEQDALQILCNQFAVALENARLYTEVQDSKIRNEIMLDQLVSGVIVANPEREITLFNNEAQRITGLAETDAMDHPIDVLPEAIGRALDDALEKRTGTRNIEAVLHADGNEESSKSIRLGTTFLFGHDEKPMGALLVFTDMTELKALEEQVRRSDQLSSVGTLAAGMAHEIKNPLVTIKTFTQLLPQRFADPDFRKDFSTLVAHEVARIDDKVNELLRFSKPTRPHLVPMKLKNVLEQTLKLIHEQMSQRGITPHKNFMAVRDDILGDEKLLSQA